MYLTQALDAIGPRLSFIFAFLPYYLFSFYV